MSHHDALHCAESGATVMLFEHSNTERGFLQHVKSNLEKEFSVEVVVSKTDRDPLVIY
jgi:putative NIF3 family GTP cyclohydrolase 1 type 2